ncbi:DUF1963 domain-containing protein [Streptomyces sp. NPDC048484]|uniref:DUF1963 domain-containing protein n=1 Tax=Streptomyces sp. NPDC048484 TaxID=3155146 RepID=UPI00341508F5
MTSVDERLVHEAADRYGVPGPVVQEVMARSRPCLHLVPYESLSPSRRENARPVGRSGGLPLLAYGTNWPEPEVREPLVLSLDCAALPHDVLDIELPADGHLLFFTAIEYPPESSVVLHVPAGAPTTERSATYEFHDESMEITVYEPGDLYPVAGLSLDRELGPTTSAFLHEIGDGEALYRFREAVRDAASGETRVGGCVQLGGFSDPWDMAPDEGDFVLLAQIPGQAIDYDVFTMNLIVGTRQDIAARQYASLQYDQQC